MGIAKNCFVHKTANVSDKAIIGEGTKIWINSQIRENSKIGNNCIISKDTYIDFDVAIGDNVKIQNGVSVYHGVTIEDDVFVGPNATFTNDHVPRAFNSDWKVSNTLIKKGASIGANSTIICGIEIGEYAMIGAGCVVTKDVPAYTLVVGNPGRIIGFICECGHKLNEDLNCSKCEKKYRINNGIITYIQN